jgi:hypothetical protein
VVMGLEPPIGVGPIPISGSNNFDNPLSFVLIIDCLSGAVAQLGERLNGIQEADGSIPFSSTIPFFETLSGYLSHCSLPIFKLSVTSH